MKIAYQDKDCIKTLGGHWEECLSCIFYMGGHTDDEDWLTRKWPCDLIPNATCAGLDIYQFTDELAEIFRI
jgi:hypothetical protein